MTKILWFWTLNFHSWGWIKPGGMNNNDILGTQNWKQSQADPFLAQKVAIFGKYSYVDNVDEIFNPHTHPHIPHMRIIRIIRIFRIRMADPNSLIASVKCSIIYLHLWNIVFYILVYLMFFLVAVPLTFSSPLHQSWTSVWSAWTGQPPHQYWLYHFPLIGSIFFESVFFESVLFESVFVMNLCLISLDRSTITSIQIV